MKAIAVLFLLTLAVCPSRAQTQEATQLVLNYEKLLQLEEILDNMYKGYKILSDGYNAIKDISEGNFDLHKTFLDRLLAVSPIVKNYYRISRIVTYQQLLIKEYRQVFDRIKNDPNLTAEEINYVGDLYEHLLRQSLRNLDELLMIVTASKLRMNDEDRLKAIDSIYLDMENKLTFLRVFNTSILALITRRAKEKNEIERVRKLHETN